MLKSKIHRATVTQADLNYVGSLTVDEDLMDEWEAHVGSGGGDSRAVDPEGPNDGADYDGAAAELTCAAGHGCGGETGGHQPSSCRHHRGGGRCGLSDRFRSTGQGDRHDGSHRGADQGRPIREGGLGKPMEFGYKTQIVDNADGVRTELTGIDGART